ncbi:MAG TPA: mechanosensitive ion channel domain-containing protein, partial [Bryobacteraceae bacterium]|nr:mechanosensitive ion channel domain-containing protein [Bryobacteraceae bacterium]
MEFLVDWETWMWTVAVTLIAGAAGLIAHRVVFSAARRFAARTPTAADQYLVEYACAPARLLFPIGAIFLATPAMPLPPDMLRNYRHLLGIILIGGSAWLLIALLHSLDEILAAKYKVDVADNLRARRIQTQVQVMRRFGVSIVVVGAIAAVLMTFPAVWNLGAGIFASAGVAGVVAGIAARPALSNLLAGMQIAFTEPIRLDDVVIVEGEFGRVEEIEPTYVVVRVWDKRRLILPLSYFIEKPFQNWTRQSSDLLGTVFVYVDYSVPVEEVRNELHRILQQSKLWDGQVWGLQVTDATEKSIQLRALMSAKDASTAWDLRCEVREKLVQFLQQNYPQALPKMRAEVMEAPPMSPTGGDSGS